MSKKVSALLVLHAMAEQNDDVLAFPLNTNFKYARTGKDGWGEITIAVTNHIIANMDSYVGSLYLANRNQYTTREQTLQDNDICPECDGSGEVSGDYFSDDGMSVCPRCGGNGIKK